MKEGLLYALLGCCICLCFMMGRRDRIISDLTERITDLESADMPTADDTVWHLENRVTTLEYRSDIFEELHKKDKETDDLQTMAIGAIIRQITDEKEDWQ